MLLFVLFRGEAVQVYVLWVCNGTEQHSQDPSTTSPSRPSQHGHNAHCGCLRLQQVWIAVWTARYVSVS